jgi:hypothetical protein
MSYNIIGILFVTISIIFGSILVYVSCMTFCIDSDDDDDIFEEEYNNIYDSLIT